MSRSVSYARAPVRIAPRHGDRDRAIWEVTIVIDPTPELMWVWVTHPAFNHSPQVVVTSRGLMDDFGTLVYTESFR